MNTISSSKKLREFWKKVLEGDQLHPPKRCPNCGRKFPSKTYYAEFWVDSSHPETPDDPWGGVGYDCYCPHCKWTGDIIPDEDRNVVHNVDKDGKEYMRNGKDWHRE